jgi:TolA-binding protein
MANEAIFSAKRTPPKLAALMVAMFASLCYLSSCKTTDENTKSQQNEAVHSAQNPTPTQGQKQQGLVSANVQQAEIALLRADIQTLSERIKTLERNLEIYEKAVRSGVWDSHESAPAHVDVPSLGQHAAPQLNESDVAQASGPVRAMVSKRRSVDLPTSVSNTEGSAEQRLAAAELKMQSQKYSEALDELSSIENDFPNLTGSEKLFLLISECHLQLENPDSAMQSVRKFYLKNPKSPEILQAKMLEARAHASLGKTERAIGVYREIISLGPRTTYAQKAKNAIQKLRDER